MFANVTAVSLYWVLPLVPALPGGWGLYSFRFSWLGGIGKDNHRIALENLPTLHNNTGNSRNRKRRVLRGEPI